MKDSVMEIDPSAAIQSSIVVPADGVDLARAREKENAAVAAAKVFSTIAKDTTIMTNAPVYGLVNNGVAVYASKPTSNLGTQGNFTASSLDSGVDVGTIGPSKYILVLPSNANAKGNVGKTPSV
ncbi:hypothetical protein ACH5RR_029284 [Cinchona calisaya]|uniref:Uncharacterized protein n=1 Tax=Cinchona calisaya TaxID=153742 RepID=A0ABD2YWF8_9GENT